MELDDIELTEIRAALIQAAGADPLLEGSSRMGPTEFADYLDEYLRQMSPSFLSAYNKVTDAMGGQQDAAHRDGAK